MVIGSADNGDVWVSELARGTLANLTTDPANDTLPLWTLDGERVAFASDRGDRQEGIFSRLADGTGPVESLLTVGTGRLLTPWDWSSDDQKMLFSYVEGDDSAVSLDIGVLQLEGSNDWEPLLQTTAREAAPSISPNGDWLAYVSDQTGRFEVYVERFPELGERRQISTSGGISPKWSPAGEELFYRRTSNDGSMMSVTVDFEPVFTPGIPEVLFEGNYVRGGTTGRRHYDVSPDGERFLMIRLTGAIESVEGSAAPITVVLDWFEELKDRVPVP
jgi:Tol biopolymer transport system component